MTDELKPCPFCGCEGKIISSITDVELVRCIGCKATVDKIAWNTRHQPASPVITVTSGTRCKLYVSEDVVAQIGIVVFNRLKEYLVMPDKNIAHIADQTAKAAIAAMGGASKPQGEVLNSLGSHYSGFTPPANQHPVGNATLEEVARAIHKVRKGDEAFDYEDEDLDYAEAAIAVMGDVNREKPQYGTKHCPPSGENPVKPIEEKAETAYGDGCLLQTDNACPSPANQQTDERTKSIEDFYKPIPMPHACPTCGGHVDKPIEQESVAPINAMLLEALKYYDRDYSPQPDDGVIARRAIKLAEERMKP